MEALEDLISGAHWFARCGQFRGEPDAVSLSVVTSDDNWDWLPTSRDQVDPVHGESMVAEANAAGRGAERQHAELSAVRWVMDGLRSVPERIPALLDGPHDFTPAARGGAAFAARMAARETIVGRPGFWWRVVGLFATGYWPCGLVVGGERIVVL